MYDRDQFRRIRADITHTAFPGPSKIRKRLIKEYSCDAAIVVRAKIYIL